MFLMKLVTIYQMFTSCMSAAELDRYEKVVSYEYVAKADQKGMYTVRIVIDLKMFTDTFECTQEYIDEHGVLF